MAHSLFLFLQLKCGRESAAAIFRMPEIFADTDGTIMPTETDAFHQFRLDFMRVKLKSVDFLPPSFWQSHLAQGGTTDIRLQRRFCGEKRSGLDPNTTDSSQIPGMKIQLHLLLLVASLIRHLLWDVLICKCFCPPTRDLDSQSFDTHCIKVTKNFGKKKGT